MPISRRTVSGIVGVIVVLVGALVGVDKVDGGSDAPASSASSTVTGADSAGSSTDSTWIDASSLPAEAREVLTEIDHGGPFEYPGKDGSVFGNFEGHLPHQASGYYHEYTVDTPGASTRGTRRIITGRDGELYWTADHYETFQRIRR
ncbi:ribonuclease domain-containing protein [Nocardioides nematodiphilus]|uniref:ribonuclease domain-containing protein n=1 Tax=Nocardioides nematodiphilus TaxID=2849669 RepID=UPI001CD9F546|nr:ribonuclease domain-containing protein [Nocardioides nematodiphilus]MCA1982471.1 ribonuclease [Nocardioides nematodiphilus]